MPALAINPTGNSHITTLSTINLLSLIIGSKEKIITLCNNEKDICELPPLKEVGAS